MSDMHVLTGDGNQAWTVVMHIPVPDTNNTVGTNWRTALVNSGMGGSTGLPDGDGTNGTISAAEKTQVEAGELYEYSQTMEIDGPGSNAASRIAVLRASYTAKKSTVLAALQRRLKFYGYTLEET
jgi:hypothetical protein